MKKRRVLLGLLCGVSLESGGGVGGFRCIDFTDSSFLFIHLLYIHSSIGWIRVTDVRVELKGRDLLSFLGNLDEVSSFSGSEIRPRI